MKWAETIRLRSTGNNRELAVALLQDALLHLETKPAYFVDAEIYLHATIATDASLALSFEGPRCPEKISALSQRLAAAISEYGLIEHAIWTVAHPETPISNTDS